MVLQAMVGLLAATPGHGYDVSRIPDVRCVSNYLFGEDALDLETWAKDLDDLKAMGFNTVWNVNVWAAYQPDADGPYDEEKLRKLRGICRLARDRDIDVLLVSAYLGEGWGPEGVDVPVWPLVPKHRAQHLRYLRWLAEGVGEFGNVFHLLCTEEFLPATVLYQPNERPESIAAFRSWAHRTEPDVGYWNERWGTEFTWETLRPLATTERKTYQAWQDMNRWFTALSRQYLPPMCTAIRDGDPDAVIGFHDFLIDPAVSQPPEERPRADVCGFDFFSIGYYWRTTEDLEGNMQALRDRVESARAYHPGLPLLCGEIGMAVRKAPPEARDEDEAMQIEWFRDALGYLVGEGVGYSLWSWRTIVPHAEATEALHREADGSPRPALGIVEEINRR